MTAHSAELANLLDGPNRSDIDVPADAATLGQRSVLASPVIPSGGPLTESKVVARETTDSQRLATPLHAIIDDLARLRTLLERQAAVVEVARTFDEGVHRRRGSTQRCDECGTHWPCRWTELHEHLAALDRHLEEGAQATRCCTDGTPRPEREDRDRTTPQYVIIETVANGSQNIWGPFDTESVAEAYVSDLSDRAGTRQPSRYIITIINK